jgi:hypothetical protein
MSGEHNRRHRERLARHLVQRRRGDLEDYLDEHTPFPEREMAEESYMLHPDYRKLLDRILDYTRERVRRVGLRSGIAARALVVCPRAPPLPRVEPGGRRVYAPQPRGNGRHRDRRRGRPGRAAHGARHGR